MADRPTPILGNEDRAVLFEMLEQTGASAEKDRLLFNLSFCAGLRACEIAGFTLDPSSRRPRED